MKIGTDGVLLGAWANIENDKLVCDIGSGTGVIALMLAQRSLSAEIVAIEFEKKAFEQATNNCKSSKWSKRIKVYNADFLNFDFEKQPNHFISNPPFFSNSFLPKNTDRQNARHHTHLTVHELIEKCKSNGSLNHKISLILPYDLMSEIDRLAKMYQYSITRITKVKPTLQKPPKRILVELDTRNVISTIETELIIETARHVYTPEYIALTRDFYLKM